jgi:nucleoside-diphosphate-sugar epimerase
MGAGSASVERGEMEGVALRYGFFYGPGTWYHPEGASADRARRQEIPIIRDGAGVWSWVHIEDAAVATADALTSPPGVYNVVNDDPSPVAVWLPADRNPGGVMDGLRTCQVPTPTKEDSCLYRSEGLGGGGRRGSSRRFRRRDS